MEAAFRKKAVAVPQAAMTMPLKAGPTARATLNPAEFRATAEAKFCSETTSCVIACHGGSLATAPIPMKKVRTSSQTGVTQWPTVRMPSANAATTIQACVNKRTRRRSNISAIAPAGM